MSKKMRESEEEISTRLSIKIWQVFDRLNQGFGGVANTIKNLVSSLPGLSVAVHLVQNVYRPRQWHATTQAQMASLGQPGGQQGFWSTGPIRYLVSQSLFPTPQKQPLISEAMGARHSRLYQTWIRLSISFLVQICRNLA